MTSHAKTYTNAFPFANGKPFTTRVLPVLKNIAPVRTAWVTRAVEALTRSTGLITRSIDAPTRSHGLITRSAEAPTRSNSLTTRAVEAPTRSHGLSPVRKKLHCIHSHGLSSQFYGLDHLRAARSEKKVMSEQNSPERWHLSVFR